MDKWGATANGADFVVRDGERKFPERRASPSSGERQVNFLYNTDPHKGADD